MFSIDNFFIVYYFNIFITESKFNNLFSGETELVSDFEINRLYNMLISNLN